jgi:transposase-like protein
MAPEIEVEARAKRRTFSAEYKLRIVQQADECREPGAVGELLRREGLYSSHLAEWRKQRDEGGLTALGKKRGRKAKPAPDASATEVARLRKENAVLQAKLEQAELIISIQKKVSKLLGVKPPTESDDDENSGGRS